MERINQLSQQILETNKTNEQIHKCPWSSRGFPPVLNDIKPTKYHHIKDIKYIKDALNNNEVLSSMIPRLRVPKNKVEELPQWVKNSIENGQQWAVMQDGESHKKLRRAFPTQYMVYKLTKSNNYIWASNTISNLINSAIKNHKIINNQRVLDIKNDISNPLSVELLCLVLGLKKPSQQIKDKLLIWAARSADTGDRYEVEENAMYYEEGHQYFLKTINEVEQALLTNNDSDYDLQNGLIAKLIKEKQITDKKIIANQCQMWVLGGSHNPANLCSLCVGVLLSHIDQFQNLRKKVQQDPQSAHQLLHQVTNEVLRIYPPAHVIVRFAECPLKIQNKDIKQGEGVILHLEEANKNMDGLQNPLDFNIFRNNVNLDNHASFGFGPHRCMGGETGQLCAEVILEQLILEDILNPNMLKQRDLRNIQLKQFEWIKSGSFKEVHNLTVIF